MSTDVASSPLGRALRALQKYDQLAGGIPRDYLVEAMDILGDQLSLECTGVRDGEHAYSHNGDTCPVHEWLDPLDAQEVDP